MKAHTVSSKRQLGHYPIGGVLFTTFLCMLACCLLGLLWLYNTVITRQLKEKVQVQVFLHKQVTEGEKVRLRQLLERKSFVQKNHHLAQVAFMSKEEAAQAFIADTGEDFRKVLQTNPLRDAYTITLAPAYQAPEQLKRIAQELEAMDAVFEVSYVKHFVQRIHRNTRRLGSLLLIFAGLLVSIVLFVVRNTIKLAMYSQRFLIRSMSLVGATQGFIKRPFLIKASLIGFLAGVLADVLLFLLIPIAEQYVVLTLHMEEFVQLLLLTITVPLLGMVISCLSTNYAMNKYLNVPLNALY